MSTPAPIAQYRAQIMKDGLAPALLWHAPDAATRLRIHAIASRIEPDLVLDPAYTGLLQREMGLRELSEGVEALLVAREAARTAGVSETSEPDAAAAAAKPRSLFARLLCMA